MNFTILNTGTNTTHKILKGGALHTILWGQNSHQLRTTNVVICRTCLEK